MKLPSQLAVLALAALLAAGPASAQEKVLREGQVTEQALIDALKPPAAAASAADEQQPRTRGFKPAVRPAVAAAGTAATAAQSGRASILVTFVTDSADLTPRAKSALDVLAAAMKSEKLEKVKFTIEGHADPRGGDERNLKLSQSRAESVRNYLMAQHGLAADRINAVGKGSTALMNTADPAAAENRRVTIVAQPG
ncbi:OmpA family protein [Rubrivivax sp. A210]|uniref:OmpA family protein n=1 Tax=Rubrivivax sp. A210 TaxID=2772301 RepID=UPI00191AB26E|nr:OmpA family protein [Rubrivivax sp. A210]CAD5373262.1 OmpA family protein [Rubrivivax sp. A210]